MFITSHSVWIGWFPTQWFWVTVTSSWTERCFHGAGKLRCHASLRKLLQQANLKPSLLKAALGWKSSGKRVFIRLFLYDLVCYFFPLHLFLFGEIGTIKNMSKTPTMFTTPSLTLSVCHLVLGSETEQ